MSEPRIAVKIVNNRFVSVFPMADPRPDEVTFPQHLLSSGMAREARHRRTGHDDVGGWSILDYARTREDQTL